MNIWICAPPIIEFATPLSGEIIKWEEYKQARVYSSGILLELVHSFWGWHQTVSQAYHVYQSLVMGDLLYPRY